MVAVVKIEMQWSEHLYSLLMTHTVKFGVYLKEGIEFLVLTFAVRGKSVFDTANLNTFIFRCFPSQKSLLDYD